MRTELSLKAARQAGGSVAIARSKSIRLTAPPIGTRAATGVASGSSSESVCWPIRVWRLRRTSRQWFIASR